MGRPEWLKEKPSGRQVRIADDDIDPARIGIFAGDLPSNPKDHTPRTNDYPRGWTTQQPWYHPQYPRPAGMRCTLCARTHEPGACGVVKVLVSLGMGS